MFIYHIRSIIVGILVVGGMVSFGIVYSSLSSPYISKEEIPQSGENISVNDDHIESVFSWIEEKEKTKNNVPKISNSVFLIPSSL